MSITGFLTDFSLSEIFRFIEQGHKTGRLMVCNLSRTSGTPAKCYYIWVEQGRIVGAADRLDNQGLTSLIAQQQWFSVRVIAKLVQWCCPVDKPLGLSLKNQRVLQDEQLQQLFIVQVLQHVCALFQLKDGLFKFDQNVPIPGREMTGLSIPIESLQCKYSQPPVSQPSRVQFKSLVESKSQELVSSLSR